MKKEQDPSRGETRADLASTRRQFMGGVGALVLGVSLLPLGIRAAQAAPKQGGSVRFAINDGAQTDSYDPATWQSSFTQVVFGGTLCNALTELDANGVAVPDVAESFAASADLKVWTFKLRPNLKFHDGAPVTANDVIESYRHHMGPKSSSAAKALVDAIVDVKGDGDGTVVFTLSGGNADFPYLVSDCHLVVMPAKAGGGLDWERGVATGPYLIEDSQPGIAVKMKRNPH